MSIDVGERVYVADVDYPMAVVGTAGRGLIIYNLEGSPKEYKRVEPPLKYQHRCISIFKDKKAAPVGESSDEGKFNLPWRVGRAQWTASYFLCRSFIPYLFRISTGWLFFISVAFGGQLFTRSESRPQPAFICFYRFCSGQR